MIDAGEVDELVSRKIKVAVESKDVEITTLTDANVKLQNKVDTFIIDNEVIKQSNKNNIHNAAISDIMVRARTAFKVEGTAAVGYDSDGTKLYGNGGDPMTISEWVLDQTKKAPHLFKQSSGGSAQGSTKPVIVSKDKSAHDKIASGLAKLSK